MIHFFLAFYSTMILKTAVKGLCRQQPTVVVTVQLFLLLQSEKLIAADPAAAAVGHQNIYQGKQRKKVR